MIEAMQRAEMPSGRGFGAPLVVLMVDPKERFTLVRPRPAPAATQGSNRRPNRSYHEAA